MGMLGACSQAVPMKKTMKKQMLFMQLWIRGWMNAGKKEGRINYNAGVECFPVSLCFRVFLYLFHFPVQICPCLLGPFPEAYAVFLF